MTIDHCFLETLPNDGQAVVLFCGMEPADIEGGVEHQLECPVDGLPDGKGLVAKHVGCDGVGAVALLQPFVEELGCVVEDVADDVC